jgi:hypothetical protein
MKFSNYLSKEIQSGGVGSQAEAKKMIKEANGSLQKLVIVHNKLSLNFYGYEWEY